MTGGRVLSAPALLKLLYFGTDTHCIYRCICRHCRTTHLNSVVPTRLRRQLLRLLLHRATSVEERDGRDRSGRGPSDPAAGIESNVN